MERAEAVGSSSGQDIVERVAPPGSAEYPDLEWDEIRHGCNLTNRPRPFSSSAQPTGDSRPNCPRRSGDQPAGGSHIPWLLAAARFYTLAMERHVEVPGGNLFVVDEGSGPPIVLLHAMITDLRSWDGLAPLLVDAGYRVVRYDLRGFGRSTTEAVPFSSRADLVTVLDALGIERAAFAGNSVGAIVTLDASLEYADRCVAAIPLAAYVTGWEPPLTEAEKALFEEEERLESADPPDQAAIAAFEVSIWVDGPGQPSGRAPAWIRESILRTVRDANDPARVFGKPIVLDPPALGRLSRSGPPILAISGELDFSDSRACGRLLVERADARHVVVPGVAHLIAMEDPARVAREMIEFLAPLRPWA